MSTETGTSDVQRRSGVTSGVTRWVENLSDTAFAYLLLTPMVLLLSAFAFWPLLNTFTMSLYADSLYGSEQLGEFVGLKHS